MQNPLAVDIVGTSSDLTEVKLDLRLGEELSRPGDMEEGLLGSQLQDHVYKIGIFEEMIELDDVDVGHVDVNPDLPLHLLSGPCFPSLLGVEDLLVDDFVRKIQTSGSLSDGVNLGKASFPKHLSSLVQPGRVSGFVNQNQVRNFHRGRLRQFGITT